MNNDIRKQLNRYFTKINGYLGGTKEQNEMFLRELKNEVLAFLIEFPNASFQQIQHQFGTPEEIAADFARQYGIPMGNGINYRKVIPAFTVIAVLLFILLLLLAIMNVNLKNHNPVGADTPLSPVLPTYTVSILR